MSNPGTYVIYDADNLIKSNLASRIHIPCEGCVCMHMIRLAVGADAFLPVIEGGREREREREREKERKREKVASRPESGDVPLRESRSVYCSYSYLCAECLVPLALVP